VVLPAAVGMTEGVANDRYNPAPSGAVLRPTRSRALEPSPESHATSPGLRAPNNK